MNRRKTLSLVGAGGLAVLAATTWVFQWRRRCLEEERKMMCSRPPPVLRVYVEPKRGDHRSTVLINGSLMRVQANNVKWQGRKFFERRWLEDKAPTYVIDALEVYNSWQGKLIVGNMDKGNLAYYPVSELATMAGWCTPEGRSGLLDGLSGLFRVGKKLWCGTSGIGVLEFDLPTQEWTRYDMKATAVPGRRAQVLYADEEFVFVACYQEHQADGELNVYSVETKTWCVIEQISTAGAWLGHTPGGMLTSVSRNDAHLAKVAYAAVPIRMEAFERWPRRIVRERDTWQYSLDFNWSRRYPQCTTHLQFLIRDLEEAIQERLASVR